MKPRIMQMVITGDGSNTLFLPRLNEHYHSINGAITESVHVYIRNGLELLVNKDNLSIFEMGFGTGLNTLLTAMAAIERGLNITYHSLDKFPIDPELAGRLNYADHLSSVDCQANLLFSSIHQAPWNTVTMIHPRFYLHKIEGDLLDFTPDFSYDLIYFDAFAPGKQPDMWTGEILHRLLLQLNPGGIFTTYCAKGEIRRLLRDNGLTVMKIPGPPGKREIMRALKEVGRLT
jgi:tRNA U34 5-methylaminomethyl-2-thiouridine-forming methyltransferase MnmC